MKLAGNTDVSNRKTSHMKKIHHVMKLVLVIKLLPRKNWENVEEQIEIKAVLLFFFNDVIKSGCLKVKEKM